MFVRPAISCALGRRVFNVGWLLAALGAELNATTYEAGEWLVEVTIAADQPAIMLGEATRYVALQRRDADAVNSGNATKPP